MAKNKAFYIPHDDQANGVNKDGRDKKRRGGSKGYNFNYYDPTETSALDYYSNKGQAKYVASQGFDWKEKSGFLNPFGVSDSQNAGAYGRAKDDYLRHIKKYTDQAMRSAWEGVMKGQIGIEQFKKLKDSNLMDNWGPLMGHTSSPWVGDASGSIGNFSKGAWDTSMWQKILEKDKSNKKFQEQKQLTPGGRTRSVADQVGRRTTGLTGINRNNAKKTLLGQY